MHLQNLENAAKETKNTIPYNKTIKFYIIFIIYGFHS